VRATRPGRSLSTMADASGLDDVELDTIDGRKTTFGELAGGPVLVVNVASRCGFTPQYEALEQLQRTYADRGFTVIGVPTNQFKQELATDDEIQEYCSTTWGVTFPMLESTWVNGRRRHPLFARLTKARDSVGLSGPVLWNFEKFLVLPSGEVHRFRSPTKPDDPAIVSLIEANLPPTVDA